MKVSFCRRRRVYACKAINKACIEESRWLIIDTCYFCAQY